MAFFDWGGVNMNTRAYSNRQEKAVANAVKGKKQANSGATTWQKGDVENKYFLIECKTTTGTRHKAFSIKEEWLEKIKEESIAMRKQGYALCFEYNPADNNRYYVISEKMFQLLNYFLEKEEQEEDDWK